MMTRFPHSPTPRALVAIAILAWAAVLAACGDDDSTGATDGDGPVGEASADSEEFCAATAEMENVDSVPSVEQLQSYYDSAPEEVRELADEADFAGLIAAVEEDGAAAFGTAFSDPERVEAFDAMTAVHNEICGLEGDEPADGTSTEIYPDAQRVEVAATEYAFDFDAPAVGAVSFVMSNDGEEPHFMLVAELLTGATMEEAFEAEDPIEAGLARAAGESDTVGPGEEAVLTIEDLPAGNYVMACFIPGPDGTPHAFSGMAQEFTVE